MILNKGRRTWYRLGENQYSVPDESRQMVEVCSHKVDCRWLRRFLDSDLADEQLLRALVLLAILVFERFQFQLSVALVPVLLSGKVGRDDRQGRKDGRVFVCSLEIKVDDLAP